MSLALDALDSAERMRGRAHSAQDPGSVGAVIHALGAVTYALLAVAEEIREWKPPTRSSKR